MTEHGEIEPVDCAIFADTGWEPKAVYDWLDWLESHLSFPVYRVAKGNLRDDLINQGIGRVASVPWHMKGAGIGMRQCTSEYKIKPLRKKARELLGYKPGQRIPQNSITMLIGISMDESQRMKPSKDAWIQNEYPLIDKRMTRGHCLEWMERNGYPMPPKSSCLGCPFHSDKMWNDLKKTEEWADIVYMDSVIRNQPRFRHEQYMHKSCVPIDQAVFKVDDVSIDMFVNECEGMCGV